MPKRKYIMLRRRKKSIWVSTFSAEAEGISNRSPTMKHSMSRNWQMMTMMVSASVVEEMRSKDTGH